VSGDIILPEDHNLQTDAITELTDVVEAISPPRIPIILPAVGPLPGTIGSYTLEFAPFTHMEIGPRDGTLQPGFAMPFQVTLKKFIVHVFENRLDGDSTISVLHDETDVVTAISIPAGTTGVFTTTIGDYVIPENGRIAFLVDLTASSEFIDDNYTFINIPYMYLVGEIG
jgi:hypothetical protein